MKFAVTGAAWFIHHRLSGLRAVGLRYFTVYGPRQRPYMAFARMVAAVVTRADTSRLESATGWRATTSLREGLAANLDRAQQRHGSACAGSGRFS